MNPPPNREVALFSAALELPASQRSAYLNGACVDDPALRQRVAALLQVHEEAIPFLEGPGPAAQQPLEEAKPGEPTIRVSGSPVEKEGDHIGRYKLLQQIGEGGCGVVYMAEQAEPVRRRVAVKVIKLGMDTKRVVARFEAERQALALMDHPNIAKVFDAGATDNGRPYFVMELVRGIKITNYCDENHLSTQERLKIFVRVCQAIQHAHQKGVIHRDIKPSNILVADHDGVPVPKVIDFGVAKATTDQQLTDKTLFTAFEQFIGTPAYMSPEQAKLSGLDIDTRTDIYSLGVLLYELLTGKTPLDQKELLAAGLDEMRRNIREKEPARPSTRLSTMVEGELTIAAKHRHTEAPKLIHLVRGDLDWIVMKALEKDRARRYETANGMAMDVQRYLADEPVVARPPSKLYRFQKLARRNKLIFAAAGGVAAALIIGLAGSTWEYLKERKARQRAVVAEAQAQVINRFLAKDLLIQATPEQNSRAKKITMEEVLARATDLLDKDTEIARQPELEATLRMDIGTTYLMLNELAEAERNLRLAFNLRRKKLGIQNLETLAAEHKLGECLVVLAQEFGEAEALFKEAWESRRRLLGETNVDTLESLEGYEIVLYKTGRHLEAEPYARQILSMRGPDSYETADALNNLAACVGLRGDYAGAEQLNRQALIVSNRKGNKSQGFVAIKQIALQRLLQGDPEEGDKRLPEALSNASRELGRDSLLTLWMQRVLARILAEEGKFPESEALARKILEARFRQASDKEGTGRTLLILGRVLVEQGKLDAAEPYLQEALKIFQDDPTRREALAAQTANWLGVIKVARKEYPAAENLMVPDSAQFFTPVVLMSPHEVRLAIGHIVSLYRAWGKRDQAADWQKKLDALPATAHTIEPKSSDSEMKAAPHERVD